jgi:hypothetical protein
MTTFRQLLRAEWTKLRTVPGWVAGIAVAAFLIVGIGLMPGMTGTCGSGCGLPVGPEGQEVTDSFTFVHRTLSGDGSITVRIASLTGLMAVPDGPGQSKPGLEPWAKAGLIVKDGTRRGSSYAAVLLTGAHGTRMQYDYVHDRAGASGTAPRWLRLTRTGATVTGEESIDGVAWTRVGTARLPHLPSTVEVGMFAASPQHSETSTEMLGLQGAFGGPTQATAVFDHLDARGALTGADWTGSTVGGRGNASGLELGTSERTGDGFTVTGSGDIAPAVSGAAGLGVTITQTLVGTFLGLVLVVVVGVLFVTAEYRRGLIRTTLAASPRRGLVLAAKALVLGAVTFLVGLVAAATVMTLGRQVLRGNGVYVHAASTATQLRVVVGTAALLAVAAMLAVGLGALIRRGSVAATTAIVVVVLPYLLAVTVLPTGPARWLLTWTPAAAFALQQSTTEYHQVANLYTPASGYFPLAPLAGFAVLAGWAAVVLGLATARLRRSAA